MEPVLNDGTYLYVRSKVESAIDLSKIVASIREAEGTSLIVEESFAESEGLKPIFKCVWITLHVNSDLSAIGFTSAFSAVLGSSRRGWDKLQCGRRHKPRPYLRTQSQSRLGNDRTEGVARAPSPTT